MTHCIDSTLITFTTLDHLSPHPPLSETYIKRCLRTQLKLFHYQKWNVFFDVQSNAIGKVVRRNDQGDRWPFLYHVDSRFTMRDFQYNEEELKADKEEMTRLSTDKKKQFVSALCVTERMAQMYLDSKHSLFSGMDDDWLHQDFFPSSLIWEMDQTEIIKRRWMCLYRLLYTNNNNLRKPLNLNSRFHSRLQFISLSAFWPHTRNNPNVVRFCRGL